MQLIGEWRDMGRKIADLQWARLTSWRQPIAQIFDNAARDNALSAFKEIEVAYSSDKPTADVFYVAGWLSGPYGAKVQIKNTEGYGPGIHHIQLRSPSETIIFERTGKECMTLRSTNGRQRQYSFNTPSLNALMDEELAITTVDPAFDIAFERAQELIREYR
jgi:glucose-6-phosphate dehydrogenase assembly protein OpcA